MTTPVSLADPGSGNNETALQETPSLFKLAMHRLWRDRLSMIAIAVLLFLTLISFGAPIVNAVLGTNSRSIVSDSFLPPLSPGHLLGADDIGRDHLARLLEAGQVSLAIGFLAAFLSLAIGVSLGLVTGYFGGFVDDAVIWLITTINSVPSVLHHPHRRRHPFARNVNPDYRAPVCLAGRARPDWYVERRSACASVNSSSARAPSVPIAGALCSPTSCPISSPSS